VIQNQDSAAADNAFRVRALSTGSCVPAERWPCAPLRAASLQATRSKPGQRLEQSKPHRHRSTGPSPNARTPTDRAAGSTSVICVSQQCPTRREKGLTGQTLRPGPPGRRRRFYTCAIGTTRAGDARNRHPFDCPQSPAPTKPRTIQDPDHTRANRAAKATEYTITRSEARKRCTTSRRRPDCGLSELTTR